MLQLRSLHPKALASVGGGSRPRDLDELAREVDRTIQALRRARREVAREAGLLTRARVAFDELVWTDRVERLDRSDVSEARKLEMVRALHLYTRLHGAYGRFLRVIAPLASEITARAGRPARVLELASGSGELALELARRAQRRGVSLSLTGSDIVPGYVRDANERARQAGLDVTFRVVDALDMRAVETGAFDLVFIAQSIHHFGPGALARVIAESLRVATAGFVGIDGRRGLRMLGVLPVTTVLTLSGDLVHDAWVSSRRFYPGPELETIARLAAPDARVEVDDGRHRYTTVTVLR